MSHRGTLVSVLDRMLQANSRVIIDLSPGDLVMGRLYAVGSDVVSISDNDAQDLTYVQIAHIVRVKEA